jgi:hypothetical protein
MVGFAEASHSHTQRHFETRPTPEKFVVDAYYLGRIVGRWIEAKLGHLVQQSEHMPHFVTEATPVGCGHTAECQVVSAQIR